MPRQFLNATVAAVALIALSIPLLIVALVIKVTSSGPVFFRQRRVGKQGREFNILKFRTMYDQIPQGSGITVGRDDRVTPVGAFLRKTKIDELPQLINVLKGDMNLVGPRPELPEFVQKYSAADKELVLSVEPGLTDFASIRYRNESELLGGTDNPLEYYERMLIPRKLRYCRFYVRRAGICLDLYIIGVTVRSLLRDAMRKVFPSRSQQRRGSSKDAPPGVFRTQ